MTQPMYTLDEARRKIAQEQCGIRGHLFTEVVSGSGNPIWVMCDRCGERWAVGDDALTERARIRRIFEKFDGSMHFSLSTILRMIGE